MISMFPERSNYLKSSLLAESRAETRNMSICDAPRNHVEVYHADRLAHISVAQHMCPMCDIISRRLQRSPMTEIEWTQFLKAHQRLPCSEHVRISTCCEAWSSATTSWDFVGKYCDKICLSYADFLMFGRPCWHLEDW